MSADDNPRARGMLRATVEIGVIIEQWEADENGMPNKIFISVPEHSEIYTVNFDTGEEVDELAGDVLAQQFEKIISRQNKDIIVIYKIRKGEVWTKESASRASENMGYDPDIEW